MTKTKISQCWTTNYILVEMNIQSQAEDILNIRSICIQTGTK